MLAHFSAHPRATKRDLAKALGVRGAERQALKQILKELAEEGLIQRKRAVGVDCRGDVLRDK